MVVTAAGVLKLQSPTATTKAVCILQAAKSSDPQTNLCDGTPEQNTLLTPCCLWSAIEW